MKQTLKMEAKCQLTFKSYTISGMFAAWKNETGLTFVIIIQFEGILCNPHTIQTCTIGCLLSSLHSVILVTFLVVKLVVLQC
jgi:hypothetical protein